LWAVSSQSQLHITNAGGHECHDRYYDVHDCVFLNCQCDHVRENEYGRVHDYEDSLNCDYVDGYADADVRAILS
jgi:hypothetical protein